MAIDQLHCPGCGAAMTKASDGLIRNECASCGGRLVGLIPLEHFLAEGVGRQAWQASEEASPDGPPCPFCANRMRHPYPATAEVQDLSVCRICQQVWLPASTSAWLASNAAAPAAGGTSPLPPVAAAPPSQCVNCGAPYEPDESGCCRFCHTQIATPEAPVIVNLGYAQPQVPSTGSRLLDGLVSLFEPYNINNPFQ